MSDTLEMKPRSTAMTAGPRSQGGVGEYNLESLITKEDVVVTVSHAGYIKRLKVDTYRAQGRGGRGIKGYRIQSRATSSSTCSWPTPTTT